LQRLPTINGIIWAAGAFGGGTPTLNGTAISSNLAQFNGNVQFNYQSYPNANVAPPSAGDPNAWRMSSWEQM